MASYLRSLLITGLLTTYATLTAAQKSGSGITTRYWDCCKPSCAWNDLETLGIQSAVKTCDAQDQLLTDATAMSGCNGGTAFMCSGQSPWAVSTDLAYGFAAISVSKPSCCQCYQLTFTSGAISGKKMIVQATNTGADLTATQFDIAIPGAGYGIFDGCSTEWSATTSIWGAQYGGSSTNTCSSFPSALQPGCSFRWDWFQGTDNPTVDWEEVSCPAAITDKSGCVKIGDSPTDSSSVSSIAVASSSTAAATSSSAMASSSIPSSSAEPTTTSFAAAHSFSDSASSEASTPVPSASSASAASSSITTIDASASASSTGSSSYMSSVVTTTTSSAPEPTETDDDDDTCEL